MMPPCSLYPCYLLLGTRTPSPCLLSPPSSTSARIAAFLPDSRFRKTSSSFFLFVAQPRGKVLAYQSQSRREHRLHEFGQFCHVFSRLPTLPGHGNEVITRSGHTNTTEPQQKANSDIENGEKHTTNHNRPAVICISVRFCVSFSLFLFRPVVTSQVRHA